MLQTLRKLPGYICFVLLGVWLLLLPWSIARAFGFNDVASQAKRLAVSSYKTPENNLPTALTKLGYDQYRDIRFRHDQFLWRRERLPFELAFFHQGPLYDSPVGIHEIVGKRVRPIRFSPELFDYGKNRIDPREMDGLGFAGFRVHYPLNTSQYKDEALVFLGASYFRALGKGQLYGLSTRALAIDTAVASGEEFPRFVQFWIERPQAHAQELTIYGLLDSPRASGAYRFVLKPGEDTAIEVKARLYLREPLAKPGFAPLTSMYLFGENQHAASDDYRPEVHDSDGLAIHAASGEWLWRPLVNPKRLLVTSFGLTDPRGFGLMQRDRQFVSYQDLEARYEARPSAWIEPKGKWGAGRVELVQIPTPDETNDNIVAFWVPQAMPAVGAPFDLEYRVVWQGQQQARSPLAWVTQTRRGHGYLAKPDDSIALLIDFEGPAFQQLAADARVEASFSADANARILAQQVYRNAVTGGWRVALRLHRADDKKAVELRGYLRNAQQTLSETWSYILPAE
ncbi:glucan biosynthesis protein G [Noviherbaspirillum sedimenti]|uniref:Glucans biosynthesis protein G n=1 Tax=Noviherbaspirillum sedimenti TaxID=2320865 RepID=A0A3A3G2T7_9BURK|nr:glucan biosynthesis protein G [Noviherbaspirillum sedimenti]RJG01975.1 glucan biosynthesis protein G [Noviherbaspirillum sedimenti]